MTIFLVTFFVMLATIAAMAIGVILTGRRISGTCGGLNNIKGLEQSCEICSKPCEKRRKALERLRAGQQADRKTVCHPHSMGG